MKPLLAVIPYCSKDHAQATRLLEWIKTLDGTVNNHGLLLVADDAVPIETKKAINSLGKNVFAYVETIMPKCPAPSGENYHVPAAVMFARAAAHIDAVYKW